jgi:uncharacterized protein (TIGR01777 family)
VTDVRVIITGGSGLIGRALARVLVARGDDVIALSRAPGRAKGLPAGVTVVGWDGTSAEGWGHLVTGDSALVNLAGESIAAGRWTATRKAAIRESRLRAGQAVVQAVQSTATKPRVLVQASAVGYYGPRPVGPCVEDASAGGDFLARVCAAWEAGTAAVESEGVRRVVIRTGVVLARDGGALPRLLLPFRFLVGGPLGSGQQPFPWIHLADEVGAIQFLLDHEAASGVYNLAAPEALTNADFSRLVGRMMHRPAVFPTPAFGLRLLFGEMATVLLDGQAAVPQRLTAAGYHFQFPQAEPALRDLMG